MTWRSYLAAVLRRPRVVLAVLLWSALEMAPSLASGYLVAYALDHGFLAGRPGLGVAGLLGYAACWALGGLGAARTARRMADVIEPLRDDLVTAVVTDTLRRAARDPLGHGGGAPSTEAVGRLTQHIETIREVTGTLLMNVRSVVLTLVAVVIGMTTLAPALAGYALAPLAAGMAVFALLLARLVPAQTEAAIIDERLAGSAGTVCAGRDDVVACGAEATAESWVAAEVARRCRSTLRLNRLAVARNAVVLLGGLVPVVLVLRAAPELVSAGRLTGGALVGAVTYLTANVQPALGTLGGAVGEAAAVLAVLLRRLGGSTPGGSPATATRAVVGPGPDGSPGSAEPTAPGNGRARPERPTLELRRVRYAYGPRAVPVVRDLTATIAYGDHLAVVGPSGTGKSTLANLLAGLATPTGGEVRLGSRRPGDDPAVRRMVALIPQEAYVFAGTLRENLTYLRADADERTILDTLDRLGAGALAGRPGGLDAPIGPGAGGLSAGQRQLVALARVHLSEACLVILDEATGHLDPPTEAVVEQAFRDRPGTLVVIAHRISSAVRADRVLFMDGGAYRVGTHQELLGHCPGYAELVTAGRPGDGRDGRVPRQSVRRRQEWTCTG